MKTCLVVDDSEVVRKVACSIFETLQLEAGEAESGQQALDSCAKAMPDAILGERTCAYVILRPGASLTLPELVTFLHAQQIAKFKLPERLEVVDAFPLTSVGKVSKKDLREDINRKLAAEAVRAE